jgi:hypothetical protein
MDVGKAANPALSHLRFGFSRRAGVLIGNAGPPMARSLREVRG